MASRHAEIADAITTYLDGLTLSQAFTPQRVKVPTFALEQSRDLRVEVLLGRKSRTLLTRGMKFSRTYDVIVIVQAGLDMSDNSDTADSDGLDELSEEIATALESQAMDGASPVIIAAETPFDEELADQSHQYLTTITVTYREIT